MTMRRVRRHYGPWGGSRGYSGSEDLENPRWTAWWLVITTTVLFFYAALHSVAWPAYIGVFTLVLAVVASARRRIKAREICDRTGHDPYRPVDGLRVLRCWRCGGDLPHDYSPDDEQVRRVATRQKQSYYSDRR